MRPAALALTLYVIYLATAFGLRSWLHWRRTGSMGFRGFHGKPGSAGWWGAVLFVLAVAAGIAAPILQLSGVVAPIAALHGTVGHATGFALALAGILATLAAQQAMGTSWRIGVDPAETTTFVRTGIFGLVRNPIFTAMLATAAGLALLAPNPVALTAFAALLAAIELQVRTVEEPYLQRTHGRDYRTYSAQVGRFLPGIGRTSH